MGMSPKTQNLHPKISWKWLCQMGITVKTQCRALHFLLINLSIILPETNSSHLKMDGWNTILSFWGPAYFPVRLLLVSGRVLTLTYLLRCEILASQVATSPDSPEVSLSVIASMLPEKVTRPGRDLCGIPEPVARRPWRPGRKDHRPFSHVCKHHFSEGNTNPPPPWNIPWTWGKGKGPLEFRRFRNWKPWFLGAMSMSMLVSGRESPCFAWTFQVLAQNPSHTWTYRCLDYWGFWTSCCWLTLSDKHPWSRPLLVERWILELLAGPTRREWGNQPLHWYIGDETSLIPYESGQLDWGFFFISS